KAASVTATTSTAASAIHSKGERRVFTSSLYPFLMPVYAAQATVSRRILPVEQHRFQPRRDAVQQQRKRRQRKDGGDHQRGVVRAAPEVDQVAKPRAGAYELPHYRGNHRERRADLQPA